MAYERDSDRMTRGVGAIAAADNSPSRYRRRVEQGIATRKRDRAMAAVGAGALGAVAPGWTTIPPKKTSRPAVIDHRNDPPPLIVKIPGLNVTAGLAPPPRVNLGVTAQPPLAPLPPVVAPPVALPVAPVTTPPSSAGVVRVVSASSGGGMAAPVATTILTAPALPDLPDLPDAAEVDHTMRNALLVVGGSLIVAYFIMRSRS